MKKFCVKCGHEFESVGREVICPSCKQAAAEESKKAAVLAAKRKSWTGESVPVRISGRASTIIRRYGAANDMPFAAALDALLQASDYFKGMQMAWEDITPYKSHRRDKHAAEDEQDTPQGEQGKTAGKPQVASKATKASKPQTAKTTRKK